MYLAVISITIGYSTAYSSTIAYSITYSITIGYSISIYSITVDELMDCQKTKALYIWVLITGGAVGGGGAVDGGSIIIN